MSDISSAQQAFESFTQGGKLLSCYCLTSTFVTASWLSMDETSILKAMFWFTDAVKEKVNVKACLLQRNNPFHLKLHHFSSVKQHSFFSCCAPYVKFVE